MYMQDDKLKDKNSDEEEFEFGKEVSEEFEFGEESEEFQKGITPPEKNDK